MGRRGQGSIGSREWQLRSRSLGFGMVITMTGDRYSSGIGIGLLRLSCRLLLWIRVLVMGMGVTCNISNLCGREEGKKGELLMIGGNLILLFCLWSKL